MITENLSTLKIHKLSKEQYERELAAGQIDPNAIYLTPDEEIDLSGYVTIEQLASKADADHTHDIADLSGIQEELDKLGRQPSFTVTFIRDLTTETWTIDKTFAEIVEAIDAGIKVDGVYKVGDNSAQLLHLASIHYDLDGSYGFITFQNSVFTFASRTSYVSLRLDKNDELDFTVHNSDNLPNVNTNDNGKYMVVENGEWKLTNTLTEADAFTLVVATGLIEPVTNEDDKVLTDENNKIIII